MHLCVMVIITNLHMAGDQVEIMNIPFVTATVALVVNVVTNTIPFVLGNCIHH